MTNWQPAPGSVGSSSAARCRNRRFTRLRTTAFPTALDTTKPTRVEPVPQRPWTTRVGLPARTPCRTVARNSSLDLMRVAAGNTRREAVSRPAWCGPCDDVRPGSNGSHGSAYADGSRGCGYADGCSAGRYACSQVTPRGWQWPRNHRAEKIADCQRPDNGTRRGYAGQLRHGRPCVVHATRRASRKKRRLRLHALIPVGSFVIPSDPWPSGLIPTYCG